MNGQPAKSLCQPRFALRTAELVETLMLLLVGVDASKNEQTFLLRNTQSGSGAFGQWILIGLKRQALAGNKYLQTSPNQLQRFLESATGR